MSTPAFEARLVRGTGLRDSVLEIEYDGTAPPTALFEALQTIGWTPPVPTPPPASAIDWSRPDPTTGARYSLRSYAAIGHAVPGPDAQDLQTVERVVDRLRLGEPAVPAPIAPAAPAPPPAAAPAPPPVAAPAPAPAPVAAPAPLTAVEPAPAPAPAAAPAVEEPPREREREVQIGATVDEDKAPAVRDALTKRGLVVRATRMSLTTPGGYRGSATAGQETAVRIQLRAPISQVDEVVAILGSDASDVVVRK